jgi:predicted nucleic acid-binding protein
MAWLERLWRERAGRTSWQALNEFYVTVTRKLRPGMPLGEARGEVRALAAWNPAVVDERLVRAAWDAQDHWCVSWWDACIVAAAQTQECGLLLSEDFQHGQDMGGVRVVNPFLASPDAAD